MDGSCLLAGCKLLSFMRQFIRQSSVCYFPSAENILASPCVVYRN
jgi:hypothetical protein